MMLAKTLLVFAAAARIGTAEVAVCEAVWRDAARNRDVPVRIRMPEGTGPAPIILFSHGLGGTLDAGTEWARAWSADGFVVVHLQHAGSDGSLMKGAPSRAERLAALKRGMDGRQLTERAHDVSFVIDELGRRKAEGRCDLTRIDRKRIGMSGHSFGAQTTQAIAGQLYPGGTTLRDPRVRQRLRLVPRRRRLVVTPRSAK